MMYILKNLIKIQQQRTQLICSTETYAYETSKFLIPKNEEIKYNSIKI